VNRRIKLLLGGLGVVVVALVVFFLLINPIRGDIGVLKLSIAEEEGRIAKANIKLAAAEDTKAEGRRNQARLLELAKMIPEDSEVPSLILQIQDLSTKAGIDFIKIVPGKAQPSGAAYQIVPLSLNFKGSFFDLSDFIYRAEQVVAGPGRLLTVKQLGLNPAEDTAGSSVTKETMLNITMTMYAFVLPAGAQAPPAASTDGTGTATDTTGTTVPAESTQ
jgi:Tfp pilus assembly protein PilO